MKPQRSSFALASRQRLGQTALGVALMAGLVVGLLARTQAGLRLTYFWTDTLFQLRARLASPPISSSIVLVTIEEETLRDLPEPMSFWGGYLEQATGHLLAAGAEMVALDLQYEIYPQRLDGLGPEYQALRARLEQDERKLLARVLEGRVLVGAQLTADRKLNLPSPRLVAVAGDRLPLLNLEPAADATIRHMPTTMIAPGRSGPEVYPTLAAKMAQMQGHKVPEEDFLINYTLPAGQGFQQIPLSRAVAGDLPDLTGKAVLVGTYDRRFGDFHRTPFSRSGERDMPGVEVHAHALATLQSQEFITVWTLTSSALSVLCSALSGLVAWTASSGPLMLSALACPFGMFVLSLICWLAGEVLLDPVFPTLAWLVCGASVYAFRSQTLSRQQADLTRTFGRMVSPQVVQTLLEHPEEIFEPEEREITVLFVDINDFTPICENLRPREVIGLLETFFTLMNEVITEFDGTVKQYVGDEIMVVFGAPHHQPDHARRAVLTALAMVEMLEKIPVESDKSTFNRVKIGVNSGLAVIGCVGTRRRFEYTAVGDTVNLASRVMGLSREVGQSIVISENTRKLCHESLPEIGWQDLGVHALKGRRQEVQVWGVIKK